MTQKKHEVVVVSSRRRRGRNPRRKEERRDEYYEAKIDKDRTPIALHHPPGFKYPFDTMEIGDSFTVPFSKTHRDLVSLRVARFQKKNLAKLIIRHTRKGGGDLVEGVKKFTARSIKEEQATRVWRIE